MVRQGLRRLASAMVLFVLLILAGGLLYTALLQYGFIPVSSRLVVLLVFEAVVGYAVLVFLGREIRKFGVRVLGTARGQIVFEGYRLVGYTTLALVLLATAGVTGTTLLAGSAFAGLILGLAGQTVFSNLLGGVMLLLTRPFEVGHRVTLTTWQYSLIAPTYPPKFYSQDFLTPGYTGTILDLGLMYTVIQLDEGPVMKLPNNIVVQAAFISHEVPNRWVRTKCEVPVTVDPKELIPHLHEKVRLNSWVVDPSTVRVLVSQVGSTVYIVSIDAKCRGAYEEPPRSAILTLAMETIRDLSGGQPRA